MEATSAAHVHAMNVWDWTWRATEALPYKELHNSRQLNNIYETVS